MCAGIQRFAGVKEVYMEVCKVKECKDVCGNSEIS